MFALSCIHDMTSEVEIFVSVLVQIPKKKNVECPSLDMRKVLTHKISLIYRYDKIVELLICDSFVSFLINLHI